MQNGLKTKMFVLALFLLLVGYSFAQDTLSFLHISDSHVIFNLEFYQDDLAENRKNYKNGVMSLETFLNIMPQKTGSDWVVATGDLIDFYEGESRWGEMLDGQIEQFVRLTEKCKVPCFLTLGNHDVVSYSWGEGERISHQYNAEKARVEWTRNASCFKDGRYYSKMLHIGESSFRFIFIDDGYYDFSHEEEIVLPYVDKEQLHWLEAELSESASDIEIIFMHIPFSAEGTRSGEFGELFSVLAACSSVALVLAGHNHKNVIRKFPVEKGGVVTQVQTGAFASNPENWRQIKVTGDCILVSQPGSTGEELKIEF
uniref:metallophosphoesterase family protein n=1 Tax=uncultured Draconibacterium sp. TaxID=1573823 RepID=UPI0032177B5B